MNEHQWVQFSSPVRKRKRAELACILCHSRKIRCDLRVRSNQGYNSCTNCSSAEKDCRPRPSKRDNGRLAAELEIPRSCSLQRAQDDYPIGRGRFVGRGAGAGPNAESADRSGDEAPRNHVQTDLFGINPEGFIQPEWPLQSNGGVPNSVVETTTSTGPQIQNGLTANWMSPPLGAPHHAQEDCGINSDSGAENPATTTLGPSVRPGEGGLDVPQSDLRQSFIETYFEYCYTWCPVFDRSSISSELAHSPLLDNALALVGRHVRPPLIPQPEPVVYYDRARRLFYDDEEEDLVTALKAISLFYWWAPRPPSVAHRHSSWWWTGVTIKHAQQAGFYRESVADQARPDKERLCGRRIWWTAFARERLTAICQGKPCLIDPDDCSIPPPSTHDFPDIEYKDKAEVFIYWVRLCAIIGRIAKELSRSTTASSPRASFPAGLGRELIEWVQSLPRHLQLPIGLSHTPDFSRDVHQLHLPYLAVIVVLHLTRSAQSLPIVLPPATLAGSCIARILKDILIRSEVRYLMPITCWYVGMAFISLQQAARSEHLKESALADLEILVIAIKELKKMWATAAVFEQTFERLRSNDRSLNPEDFPNRHLGNERSTRALHSEAEVLQSGIDWMDYFPFVTPQTSLVAEKLLAQQNSDPVFWTGLDDLTFGSIPNYQDFMEGLDGWIDPTSFP
ncbi:hypothetical protein PHISCL_02590 [Aspergillus sclerotialis]|uniref:Zn(2)-C6 fungal-type domain-containing protein n=1 Tax=Aspergillus sclerotialis TaxID=2070753 RepID=A0A3A3A4W9_9EURO|nr:hypothetical protein PHISCL_02590 [Aspergillus sclerotialis]